MVNAIGYVVIGDNNSYYKGKGMKTVKTQANKYKQIRYNEFDDMLDLAYVFTFPGTAVRKAKECNGIARVVAVNTDTHKRELLEGEVTPIVQKKGE